MIYCSIDADANPLAPRPPLRRAYPRGADFTSQFQHNFVIVYSRS